MSNPVLRFRNILWLCIITVSIFSIHACKKDPFICLNGLMREPYIQMAGTNAVTIKWRTCYPTETLVRYGPSPGNLTDSLHIEEATTEHQIRIKNLKPSTTYYYSIGTRKQILQGNLDNRFTTFPVEGEAKKTRIWAIGDAGSGNAMQRNVRDSYMKYTGSTPTDVWLWLGDNAYEDGTDEEYHANVFVNGYEKIMKNTCVWSAIGNHDFANVGYLSPAAQNNHFPYYDIFEFPLNAESGGIASNTEKYYSFNYGNIHFICIDSYSSLNDPGSTMYQWIERDLAENKQKWTIAYMHHPPYSKGSHDSDKEQDLIDIRQNIVPLLEKHSVDLVLTGHSHSYERSYLLHNFYSNSSSMENRMKLNNTDGRIKNPYIKEQGGKGTVYAVVGVSGKLGGKKSGWPHPAMAIADNKHAGSFVVDIDGDQLTGRFIGTSSNILDEFHIIKK